MPINPMINMSYRNPELPNPLANALSGQKLQAMQMENQANAQQMEQMNSPEYKQQQAMASQQKNSQAQMAHLKELLPLVQDQASLDAVNQELSTKWGMEIPPAFRTYGAHIDKVKEQMGITKPAKESNPELDAANIMLKRSMAENLRNKGDIGYQEELSRRKSFGSGQGEIAAKNSAPVSQETMAGIDSTINAVDALAKHAGKQSATGGSSLFNVAAIPGSDRKDFLVKLDQLKNKLFLQARAELKGGGAITDYEGQKAENAMAQLDTAQSEEQFNAALSELSNALISARQKLANRAQQPQDLVNANPMTQPKTRKRFNPATGMLE